MRNLLFVIATLISSYAVAQDREFKLNENYSISSDGVIELSSSDAKVNIKGTDRTDVLVDIYRKVSVKGLSLGEREFQVEVYEDDGNLIIKERTRGSVSVSMVAYRREVYTIDIEAPKGVSLRIEGDDDDYFIENIHGSVSLDIDDGDAELMNCSGNDFYFDFDDGNIKMDRGDGRLKVKSDDGDISIRKATFSEVDVNMDDGDIEIETSLADDGSYLFRSSDGGIYFNVTEGGGEFLIYHDDTRVSVSGDFDIDRDEEDETRLKLGQGTANIKMRVDDGRVQIKADN
ncbi:MAG: DUF4097 family beta strand repeat-containing protein [Bacteroidota bacterium]